ncbi:MAG: GNAT family N-acetyltransferase [bacterium]
MERSRSFENPVVELRPLNIDMQVELFNLFQSIAANPRMSLHLPWILRDMTSTEAVQGLIVSKQKKEAAGVEFARVILSNSEIAGVISYSLNEDNSKHAEIGYFLGPTYTGRGIAVTALKVITSGLISQNLQPVLNIEYNNIASQKVAIKAGFEYSGDCILHNSRYYQYFFRRLG